MAVSKLREGDYCPDGSGAFDRAVGEEEVLERVLFQLTARRGSFPLLPQVGSRLSLLCREKPAARAALAAGYAAEALADQPVHWRQPVYGAKGLLNNPEQPYWGSYSGDEDTRRKVAYHNGTAWCWQLPMFCEALFRAYGPGARDAALAILGTAADAMGMACIGHLPEIIDGSLPHLPRGCCAQAWSATEFRRVAAMLSDPTPSPGRDGAR